MRLTNKQIRQLLDAHGVVVSEACNKCGQILGPVRFTNYNEPGVWCSRACRDGVDQNPGICRGCGTSLDGKRRGAIYCDRTCRMRTVRQQVRNSTNIVNTPIQKTGVADAISKFGYGYSRASQNVSGEAGIEVSREFENTSR
jgi:hypothetical protein